MLRRCAWLMILAAGGCTESGSLERAQAATAEQRLTDGIGFDGGTVIEALLPMATADDVRIAPVEATVIVAPGQTGILSLRAQSATEDSDPIEATLVRFGSEERHVSVPRAGSDLRIENAFTVEPDACASLCQQTYAVEVTEAALTAGGEVGTHSTRTLALDCSEADVPPCDEEMMAADEGTAPGGEIWTARILTDIRDAATQAWRASHGCTEGPQRNALADSAASDLLRIGIDTYASADFAHLGPETIMGTWQSIAFSEGEEAMAAEAAAGYGGEVTLGECDSTSLGLVIEPSGARFAAGLVWLQCVQCGDVCAPADGAACTATGM